MLHLPVPGNSSLGVLFPEIKRVFFSEWQEDEDFITQTRHLPQHSSVPQLHGHTKRWHSSWSVATNADKEKQDAKKVILTKDETSTCFLH